MSRRERGRGVDDDGEALLPQDFETPGDTFKSGTYRADPHCPFGA